VFLLLITYITSLFLNLAHFYPEDGGRSYIGATGRLLAEWLHKHRNNLREGLLEKSNLD
jgi:hypothetical protein